MIGTSKQEIKAFVEQAIANYKNSVGYSVIGAIPKSQQDFINGKLYDLFIDAKKSSSKSTLHLLKEVLDEYPGFSDYFAKQDKKPKKKSPDLPWCDYVSNPNARKFWGLNNC